MTTKKETFTGNIEDLDAWVDGLSNGELNRVLYYLTTKEMQQLKKAMDDSKGKVVTARELEENSIVPELKNWQQFIDEVKKK